MKGKSLPSLSFKLHPFMKACVVCSAPKILSFSVLIVPCLSQSTGRTVLIIAHRLSTIQNANAVAVLDQRRVAECGQHAELLGNRKGLFRKLMEKQVFLQEGQKQALC